MQTHNNAVFKMREEMRFGQKEREREMGRKYTMDMKRIWAIGL